MSYVILDPINMTYDGGYSSKKYAEEMLEFCRKDWGQPKMFLIEYDGIAADFEPEFTFMADKKYNGAA